MTSGLKPRPGRPSARDTAHRDRSRNRFRDAPNRRTAGMRRVPVEAPSVEVRWPAFRPVGNESAKSGVFIMTYAL